MGAPVATSFGLVAQPEQEIDHSQQEVTGVASMGMRAQVWWIKNTGFDGRSGGKIFDSRRRESRRRGEELFRHDVDKFELHLTNLVGAPGCYKKKIRRGRGKYGHHGRTCGFGQRGANVRGRRTLNPGYEGGHVPLHHRTPKLSQDQLDSMKRDPFTHLHLKDLNLCDDGDEVDYMDLFTRGYPVKAMDTRFDNIKVRAEEKDELTVKNLTVYAHAFEPTAREKIEANGGKCIRLHEFANIPVDAEFVKLEGSSDE